MSIPSQTTPAEVQKVTPRPRPRPRLISLEQVREQYFSALSKSTLQEHFARGRERIPGAVRIGRRVLIDANVVEEWLAAGAPPLDGGPT